MSTILDSVNQSEAPVARSLQKSSTVLILDNNKEQLNKFHSWLHSNQVEVLLCPQVSAVRKHFSERTVDLLILEYELDEGNALELVQKLESEFRRKIPFIIVTDAGSEEIAVQVMKHGASDYLVKDDRLEERLQMAANSALERVHANQILANLEGELTQFEQRTRHILNTAAEAFVSIDGYGTIIDWNASAETIFGYRAQEIIGKNITETIVPERYREQVSEALCQFQESRRLSESLRSFETTALNKDGREVPIALSLNIVELEAASIITGFAHDISKRCELESQLIQSEKMASLGQLAAGVAHEINNPVGFVTSNVATLEDYIAVFKQVIEMQGEVIESLKGSDESSLKKKLDEIEAYMEEEDYNYLMEDIEELIKESNDGLVRVKEIVQNLKSFARVDEAETKEADINECLKATIKVVWNEIKYNCELVQDFGKIPQIRCYPGQLNHVFMNLLVNAAHAIKERGTIVVTTEADDKYVIVKIQDDGHGIKPEHIPNLFTPFFTTKPVGKGTGLGLSIAYGIIQKHKGFIEVESEVDKGTTFTVKLPLEGVEG
ncbi:MAG: PAS domain S-box protein [Planctomycetaceae bacterium]|nr:PAS domain S-box protein [Planctomycetaceae bacterium]